MLTQAASDPTRATVERTIREEWGRVLASLNARVRDLELAEDSLQEAVVTALQTWPGDGLPDHPAAWLLTTARRKAIDRIRRDRAFESKRSELLALAAYRTHAEQDDVDSSIPDDRLQLIFTCCHPAIAEQSRVALTLCTLGGLTTSEIAHAFLVPESTMAQRLVRAKNKIKAANIPYRVPPPDLWAERFESVLAVIYLIFNEGYAATSGPDLTRADLSQEAIRLGRFLVSVAPHDAEGAGLLALMLLHDARRDARTDPSGRFVPLEHQDRGRWNGEQIAAGVASLERALNMKRLGPYQVQAAISAVHVQAESYAATDWRQIVGLYDTLRELQPSPVVKLNAVVALAMVNGPEAGLDALVELKEQGALERYQPYHAARADLLRRAGRFREAMAAYRDAIVLTGNLTERRFLEERLQDVSSRPASGSP